MKNKVEITKMRNENIIFIATLLITLYAMDFIVLANIILSSLIITKIVSYIVERLGV